MSAAEILRRAGRSVPTDRVAAETAQLGSLPPEVADEIVLATYDVVAGAPGGRFVPDRGNAASLRAVLDQGRPALLYVLVAAGAALVPAIAVPLLLRLFVDRYLVAGDPSWVAPVLVGLVGAAVVAASVVALEYAVLRRFALRLERSGTVGFTWHVLTMPPPRVAEMGGGDLVGRLNAQHRLSYQGGLLLPLAMVNLINGVVFAAALVALDVTIGIAALVVAALSVVASLGVLRWRRSLQRRSDRDLVRLTSVTADVAGSMDSIKAAAWELFAFRRWAAHRGDNGRSLSRLGLATQLVALVPTVATALGLGAVLATGCLLVMRGAISIGTVVAAQAYAVLLLEALAMLVWSGVLIQSVVSAAAQADEVLRIPQDPETISLSGPAPTTRLAGDVALRDLTFGYRRDAEPLLREVTVEVPAGSRLAIVGTSGSGKSTLARLIVGELQPWRGDVLLDGHPRLLIPRGQRTRDIAYVPQDPVLFAGTLRDNLTMWDDSVSDADVLRAASDACIGDAILARPGGFEATVGGDDGGFSGGEQQRLAIARALVRDPRILVLDEATSALDPLVEAEVAARLNSRGCTTIVVAHRLSTIRDADRIVVMEAGRIVQTGTFAELRHSGPFAELLHG